MIPERTLEALRRLPAEKQTAVARLIELLAEDGEADGRASIPSWRGIIKGHGPAPTFEDCLEARRECWSLERRGDPI